GPPRARPRPGPARATAAVAPALAGDGRDAAVPVRRRARRRTAARALGRPGAGAVNARLDGRSVIICAGSGGVGKTTTSAALALGLAAQGKTVAVVTIDPAKRLAN